MEPGNNHTATTFFCIFSSFTCKGVAMSFFPMVYKWMFLLSLLGVFSMAAGEVAEAVKIFPSKLSKIQWIWNSGEPEQKAKQLCFRSKLHLSDPARKALLRFAYGKEVQVFVNGIRITPGKTGYDIAEKLMTGNNLIAIASPDSPQKFGVLFRCDLELESGKRQELVSDASVLVSDSPGKNWMSPDYDDSAWIHARELGNVALYPGGIATNYRLRKFIEKLIADFATPEEQKNFHEAFRQSSILDPAYIARLNREPECDARIVWKNNYPFIQLNGVLYNPVMRLGVRPGTLQSDDFIYKMRGKSLRFYTIMQDTDAMYSYNDFWEAPGRYDFSNMEGRVSRLLKMDPEAYLFIEFYMPKMKKWCLRNPDELVGYATGPVQDEKDLTGEEVFGRHRRPSPASTAFREEVRNMLVAMCDFIKSRPWRKRIMAIRCSFGVTCEWMYFGSADSMPDTGKAMTERFRIFLRKRYRNDTALQKAWHDPNVRIADIQAPGVAERVGRGGFFRNPNSRDRKVMDFYDCMHETMADLNIFMGKIIRENLPGRLYGAYDGYDVGKIYPPEGEHTMTERLLRSPYIDYLSAPYNYTPLVRIGGGSGQLVHMASLFAKYKKLSMLECDIRTHLAPTTPIGTKTPKETNSVIRRDMCITLFDRTGIQFTQFGGTYEPDWFNSDAMRKEIHENNVICSFIRTHVPTESPLETAVVYHTEEFRHHGWPSRVHPFLTELKSSSLDKLRMTGHDFDLMSFPAFLASGKNYKVVVFLNTFTVNPEEMTILKRKLHRPGVTAIWTYAPGLLTGKGFSSENMTSLTGIALSAVWKKLPLDARLANGKRLFINAGKGESWKQIPRISASVTDAEVIATYRDDGSGAIVRKKLPNGSTSVFLGFPLTDTGLWRKLLNEAGSFPYGHPEQLIRVNSSLILVHSRTSGKRKIRLPHRVSGVVDVFNRKIVAENVMEFTFDDPENTTSLFYYGRDWRNFLNHLKELSY